MLNSLPILAHRTCRQHPLNYDDKAAPKGRVDRALTGTVALVG